MGGHQGLHGMITTLGVAAEPEAMKKAEKTITAFDIQAILAAEKAFVKAVNRKTERKSLAYFFGILRRIQQERDDQAYASYCRARYNYEQMLKRERARQEQQEQNAPPKIESIIEMLVQAETAPSRKIRAFAARRAKEWIALLVKGKSYLGTLEKKVVDALAVMNRLSAEKKNKIHRIFKSFLQNPAVESVT